MEKQLGKEGKFKLSLENGKVKLSLAYDGTGIDGELTAYIDGIYFVDEVGKLIPGESVVETFTLGALKAAFMAAKV
jgi:hypothetical protein